MGYRALEHFDRTWSAEVYLDNSTGERQLVITKNGRPIGHPDYLAATACYTEPGDRDRRVIGQDVIKWMQRGTPRWEAMTS